ncbi:MAG: copper chaperone PCu(A)C [Magnetovibrio sp.]|nr:copper chaperone PCu(A)C [Magnetovibrio sp.]
MKIIQTLITATALATMAFTSAAMAGDMTVSKPWARASAGMAKAGASFMYIFNETGMDDTLIAARGDVAKRIELHTHLNEDGVMKMRQVKGGIPLTNGATQILKPGSYHVMMMGLAAPLKEGTSFPITLIFKHAGEQTVIVEVKSAGHMGEQANHAMGGMKKQMDGMANMGHATMEGMKK